MPLGEFLSFCTIVRFNLKDEKFLRTYFYFVFTYNVFSSVLVLDLSKSYFSRLYYNIDYLGILLTFFFIPKPVVFFILVV